MRKEQIRPNNEQSNQSYRLDKELDSANEIYSGIQKARWVRDHLIELKEPKGDRAGKGEMVESKRITKKAPVNRYVLPGIGKLDSTDEMQEMYKLQGKFARYKETPNCRVSWVEQGTMLEMPKSKTPYALASMSECSFLVGVNKNNIIAAHISYSLKSQIIEVLDYFENAGIRRDDTYTIANTNPATAVKNRDGFLSKSKRITTNDEYEDLNIPEENIRTFTYNKIETDKKNLRKNLQLVVASPDMIFTSGFNQDLTGEKMPPRDQRFPKDKEQLIKL